MADINYIQPYGMRLVVHFKDGSKLMHYNTGRDIWKPVKGGSGPGPLPDFLDITDCDGNTIRLEKKNLAYAQRILLVSQSDPRLGRKGAVCAFMTSLVETGRIQNYSNVTAYPESASCPDPADADGSDNDSVGLFQQRPSAGWGAVCDCMNPEHAARAFFGIQPGVTAPGMVDIPGWETMGYGELCQAIQVSAFPDRYDCWRQGAEAIYDALMSGPGPSGGVVWPFSLADANINNGYPEDGFETPGRPNHQGMDFAFGGAHDNANMPCSADGTVEVAGDYQGYGNAVIVNHGVHNGYVFKTLYGHMYPNLQVSVGQSVTKGQTLGFLDNSGNSFGSHLHFETWSDDVKRDPLIVMGELNPNNDYWGQP